MVFPTPNKNVVDKLSDNNLLFYVLGAASLCTIAYIAKNDSNSDFLKIGESFLVFLLTFVLSGFAYMIHKNSTEKVSVSLESLEKKVGEMTVKIGDIATNLNNMNEQLKLADLGDTTFGENEFQSVWKKLTFHTEESFYAMSYMNPEQWNNEKATFQIRALGSLQGMAGNITIKRLFILESEEELQILEPIFQEHLLNNIDIRYILRGDNEKLRIGINISDDTRGAIYHYTDDRKVDGGRLIYKDSEVKYNLEIFRDAWKKGNGFSCKTKI